MALKVEKRLPTAEEYNNLKQLVGWPVLETSLTKKGIANSLFAVCVINENIIVGTGRMIGDGAIYYHI